MIMKNILILYKKEENEKKRLGRIKGYKILLFFHLIE